QRPVPGDLAGQPGGQVGGRPPTEDLGRGGGVAVRAVGVPGPVRPSVDRQLPADGRPGHPEDVRDRHRVAVGDVQHGPGHGAGLQGGDDRPGDVTDIREVAELDAVAVQLDVAAVE